MQRLPCSLAAANASAAHTAALQTTLQEAQGDGAVIDQQRVPAGFSRCGVGQSGGRRAQGSGLRLAAQARGMFGLCPQRVEGTQHLGSLEGAAQPASGQRRRLITDAQRPWQMLQLSQSGKRCRMVGRSDQQSRFLPARSGFIARQGLSAQPQTSSEGVALEVVETEQSDAARGAVHRSSKSSRSKNPGPRCVRCAAHASGHCPNICALFFTCVGSLTGTSHVHDCL